MDLQRLGIILTLSLIIPLLIVYKTSSASFSCSNMIKGLESNMWPTVITDELRKRYCNGTGKVLPHQYLIIASKPSIFPEPLDLQNMNRRESLIALNSRLVNSNVYYLYKDMARENLRNLLKDAY